MNNDPAVLFYTSDFLTGVMDMTMEERGQYITLLCYQHQKGHIKEETIRLLLGYSVSDNVLKHFRQDEEGNYYNSRMDIEKENRKKFTESRRENGKKGGRPKGSIKKPSGYPNGKPLGKATENHMGNEDEDENIIDNLNNNLFSYIEETLGRLLSPVEYELISTWEDNEVTRHAIKQTALQRATSLKYTQGILNSYKTKGLTNLADIEADEKKFNEEKNKKTNSFKTQKDKDKEFIARMREEIKNEQR